MQKTLIIMAAWLGSRYWGLKQVDTFWPNWETIVEYSIYDAIQEWCNHVVLVIQEQHEQLFEDRIWKNIRKMCDLTYVYQWKKSLIPEWFDISHREKPWWTAHALLVCKDVVDWPAIVINADDWYGREGYWLLYEKLEEIDDSDFVMVWYPITNTIPEEWSVNRGVCSVENWILESITEHHAIHYKWLSLSSNESSNVPINSIVSMNFWWFTKGIFEKLQAGFDIFLDEYGSDPRKEFYISTMCNDLISSWKSSCYVVRSSDKRSWVTNKEDKPILQKFIQEKIKEWYYPTDLWNI